MSRKTLYNSVMKVKRLGLSSQDAVSGIVQTKITVFSVPCRIRQLDADERFVGGKDGVVSTHRVYCKEVKVKHFDEVIISKFIYDVDSINPGSAHKGTIEIDCRLRA